MPYKIYTYVDPYNLDKADFWPEIAALPHFCVSRTLVNGLKENLRDSIHGLLCPLDDFVSHESVYYQWTRNISLRVRQHSELTALFKACYETRKIDEQFYLSLQQNESRFLEAIRLFIELDIPASSLNDEKGNPEQKLFVSLLEELQSHSSFQFPQTADLSTMKSVLIDLAEKELAECKSKNPDEQAWYQTMVTTTRAKELNAIVIHGVHQFSPAQLHLILNLEKQGITIIFLYNYQSKYPSLYSSWANIYNHFNVPTHHDSVVTDYITSGMQNPSNALACALGEICEGRYHPGNKAFKQWHQLYQSIQMIEFENITEYAHFVSSHVHAAERKLRRAQGVIARGNDTPLTNAQVLNAMTEQVYTANRDVHTLLKIYHPEFAKDRHFLAYPIGQFFSSIYKLWNYERQEIDISITELKECLSSNVLTSGRGENLLRTFYNVELVFRNIKTYSDFRAKFVNEYLRNYDKVQSSTAADPIYKLRRLSIFNAVKARKKDILSLSNAIEELNTIAQELFAQGHSERDYINFGQHFTKLESFLKRRELIYANEEERALIAALQTRLEGIQPEKSAFSGSFKDLQEGLHYYLKQKEDEESVDWIVKNFEQIDGDILNSKPQFEKGITKVYHFACLSDRDMNQGMNDLLPWPLTESFIQAAYDPIDLQFQVYWTALDERSSFLRYSLFYGLFFNRCDVRVSYVKQYDDEVTEPYALLPILGLQPEHVAVDNSKRGAEYSILIPPKKTDAVKSEWIPMMDMFLCPYRYLLEYIVQKEPVIQGDFLTQKFFDSLLVEATWNRIQDQQSVVVLKYLRRIVDSECKKFAPFFSFWTNSELYDLKRRATNFLRNQVIGRKPKVEKINLNSRYFMQARYEFGKAKFTVPIADSEPINPYAHFEKLSDRQFPQKIYSYSRIAKGQRSSDLLNDMKDYLNQTSAQENIAIPSDWCTYCPQKGVCVEAFLQDN